MADKGTRTAQLLKKRKQVQRDQIPLDRDDFRFVQGPFFISPYIRKLFFYCVEEKTQSSEKKTMTAYCVELQKHRAKVVNSLVPRYDPFELLWGWITQCV